MIVAVHDFAFQGGTLGMAVGEAIVEGMSVAIERRTPFIIFTASGGARMQEGMFSLMQMRARRSRCSDCARRGFPTSSC